MSEETGFGTQTLNSSSQTIEPRFREEPEIETPQTVTSVIEQTLRLVDERIKQMIDPIFRQVEELCALLAGSDWDGIRW